MKKIAAVLLFFIAYALSANDYKWDLINALSRNDYPAAEKLINANIEKVSAAEKPLIMNFALTYSRGETTLQVLNLLQRYNICPGAYDLYTAIGRNQPDSVIYFIVNQGVRANGEILLLAMEMCKFDLAKQFILDGADINYHYPLTKNYADGMTALLHACKNDNLELVMMLVERGANINIRDKSGGTALSYAQANENQQMSEFLILKGANPNFHNTVRGDTERSGGIGSFLDTGVFEFKPGNYRLSRTGAAATTDADRNLRFSGSASYGIIGLVRNNRALTGTYQSAGGGLTLILEGRSFAYRIDSENSFSGNGEVWVRTGD